MQRVLVLGSGGAGKSTFARALGAATGLPVVHLDREYWQPGWVALDKPAWAVRVRELCARDAWIMDGNYGGSMEARLAACDTAIFLDVPRAICLARVVKRRLQYRGHARPDMTPGCEEQLSWEFVRWVWRYPIDKRAGVIAQLDGPGRRGVILRGAREARAFLNARRSG
jgi:adenylate kinase family enzyme